MKKITVIGSDGEILEDVRQAAELVGKNIAESGCVLVCGGRGGVMQAACRGAKSAGGVTVGILPSQDGSDANEFVDIIIPTGFGTARNALVVLAADAVVAVCGSTGTLSEIAMALNYEKPVVAVTNAGGVAEKIKKAFPENERIQKIVESSAEEAVEKAIELIKK